MFKNELIEFIREDYQELQELSVEIDGQPLEGTLYNLLTPYLAHKNTIDKNNRIISFYTKEGSKQQKLLPIYIGLSNYYKAFNQIQSEYDDTIFEDNILVKLLDDIECEIPKEFKYLNNKWRTEELTIDIEKNNKIHLYIESIEKRPRRIAPMIQDILPSLKKYIPDYRELEQKVLSTQKELNNFLDDNIEFLKFKQIRDSSESKIGINEILKLGSTIKLTPSSGVLLFTNKTKYRKLIEDTYINGKPVTETFPIAEIKFNSTGELETIGEGETPSIIYFCSLEYYAGWKEIIEEIGAEYLNTIVIDDFNSIIQKETRRDFEYFRDFSKSILEAQKSNTLKDVYFLDEDSNFHTTKTLEQFNMDCYPWLLNFQERNSLIGKDLNEICHKAITIQDDFGSSFWTTYKLIIIHLSSHAKELTNIEEKAKALTLLNKGYIFLSRATSFYSLGLKLELLDYISELENLNEFSESASFRNKVSDFSSHIKKEQLVNSKLKAIINILKLNSRGSSVIVSKNTSQIDKKFATELIAEETGVVVDFIETENTNPNTFRNYSNAFFLHFSGKITKTLFLSKHCKNQYLILNDKSEGGYYKKCFNNYTPEIVELSDFDNKLILLNLEEKDYLVERNKIDYNIDDYLEESPTQDNQVEKIENIVDSQTLSDIDEQDFSFVIESMLQSEGANKDSTSSEASFDNYLIMFEKSFVKVPQWRYFHILDDIESSVSRDNKVKVPDLKIGDKVFLMEGFNNDFNELLVFLKNEYNELKIHFDKANSWRQDLQNQYETEGGFYSRLNDYLKTKGVNVSNPTVEKWVSGITIMPDSLEQLIEIFKEDPSSFSTAYSKDSIIESTRWLAKFRTSLNKEIFQYHVYKKYGMQNQINNLKLKSLIEKMDDIVSIQEIIMIQKQ